MNLISPDPPLLARLAIPVLLACPPLSAKAEQLLLECDVKTTLQATGQSKYETAGKITLKVDTNTGAVEGGIAGELRRTDTYRPSVSAEKFSATGGGRRDRDEAAQVISAGYEINRYSGNYRASIEIYVRGIVRDDVETGVCAIAPGQRRF